MHFWQIFGARDDDDDEDKRRLSTITVGGIAVNDCFAFALLLERRVSGLASEGHSIGVRGDYSDIWGRRVPVLTFNRSSIVYYRQIADIMCSRSN